MPNYNIRLGNQRFRLASTDKPVSQAIGKHLAGVTPETKVDSRGGHHSYSFDGQEIDFEDLRDIKDIRDSGGQVAQLVKYKSLLNFGEGAEFHVENEQEHTELVDGVEMTLTEWLEQEAFPHVDLLVLDLGEDALWYPAAYGELRENQVGEFAEFLPAEPWTILPKTNSKGEIVRYHQRVKSQSGGYTDNPISADELESIILNKQSARDKTGISEVLRNRDEIQAFKENEQAINQAIELHGFPQRHVKVGREDSAPIRDDDLRRVRTIFDPKTSDANTAYFTGQDVDVDTLEAHQFDYGAIHEMDMRNLTTALGLPLEAGNVGSDGLGSGKPAELRFALLKLAIKANQRSFSTQFVSKVVRPVLRDYSPFDHTAPVSMEIDDPLEDIGEMAEVIGQIGDYMTNAEIRRKLDLPEPEDDEISEGYRTPADIEAPEGEGGDGPFGGMFSEGKTLQAVPDNAVSISDRSEAPEGASVIEGPKGGLYYVPGGGDDAGGGEGNGDAASVEADLEDIDAGETTTVDATVEIDGEEVDLTGDEVEVQDAFPDIGMLIEHPEHGRLEIDRENIDSIGGDTGEGGSAPDPPAPDPSPSPDQGTDAPTHEDFENTFSLDNSVEQSSLADVGASQGKTAENMTVHEMDDGSTAFVKEFGEDAIDPTSRDQTLAGYEVMKQVAPEQVPSHSVLGDGDQLAVRGVEGTEVGNIPDDVDVDAGAFARGGAAQVLMGNDDARPENVLVTPEGDPMFVDLDEAGDMFGEPMPERDFRDAFRRAAKSMSEATGVSEADAIDQMADEAIDMAGDVDASAVESANEGQGPVVAEYISAADEETLMQAAEDAKEYLGVA